MMLKYLTLQLSSSSFSSALNESAFAPIIDDIFTVRVEGRSSTGTLNIKGSVLTPGSIQTRNQIQVINLEEGKGGVLARNAFDEYKFTGSVNKPVVIRTQVLKGSLSYSIQVFDPTGNRVVDKSFFNSSIQEISLTPSLNGNFIIRIEAIGVGFGEYNLSIINSNESLR